MQLTLCDPINQGREDLRKGGLTSVILASVIAAIIGVSEVPVQFEAGTKVCVATIFHGLGTRKPF